MGLPDIDNIPETGAVFTLGRSRFADNIASHFFIRKDPVVSIACGDEHSAIVCQSGRLFVFGSNDWGQLGLGHKNHVSKPSCVKILKPEKVTHVACGRAHTLICTGHEKLLACGSDQESQLGRGQISTSDSSTLPVVIYDSNKVGSKILQIAAGSHHSLALTIDGDVLAWGSNLEGQLGLPGTSGLINKPTKVNLPEPVKQISAGYYHSAFLTKSGVIYICGEAESGKLGIALDFRTQIAPKQMQLPVSVISVACGGHHTLLLGENGDIYCTGSNASGQLGMGTNITEIQTPKQLPCNNLKEEIIKKIVCGESHVAIITESGKLFMCGDGRHGKLGLEENENNVYELTYVAKYEELIVTNVACGGCHTILVGRKKNSETDNENLKQTKINSLPPLKVPINRIQNDDAINLEDESKNQIKKSEIELAEILNDSTQVSLINLNKTDDNIEKPESPKTTYQRDTPTLLSNKNHQLKNDDDDNDNNTNCNYDNNIENDDSNNNNNKNNLIKDEIDTKAEVNTSAIEIRPKSYNDQLDVNRGIIENKEKDCENNKENKQDNNMVNKINDESITIEKSSVSLPVTSVSLTSPPLKPPRQKIDNDDKTNTPSFISSLPSSRESSCSGNKNEKKIKSIMNNDAIKNDSDINYNNDDNDDVSSITSDNKKTSSIKSKSSAQSKADTDETIAIDDTKILQHTVFEQNVDDHLKDKITDKVDEKINIIADNVDDNNIIQSPLPRTGKIIKLFKNKKQQVSENLTNSSSSIEPIEKAKSKTCSIL
ncbi:X-linked retinitis pigmentosa GTPase regulator [Microplitis demolitor]|uniref:X-linked retinitis pigmentosa GTPase regulator n=1 Tax=Microplitis demolitor TaxID=69319 RepID=UPI0006D4D673|nr:X-linked retinitis pigmentosa GTPase regulator [Microplitis demolitor]